MRLYNRARQNKDFRMSLLAGCLYVRSPCSEYSLPSYLVNISISKYYTINLHPQSFDHVHLHQVLCLQLTPKHADLRVI